MKCSTNTVYRIEHDYENVPIEQTILAAKILGLDFDNKTLRVIPPPKLPRLPAERRGDHRKRTSKDSLERLRVGTTDTLTIPLSLAEQLRTRAAHEGVTLEKYLTEIAMTTGGTLKRQAAKKTKKPE